MWPGLLPLLCHQHPGECQTQRACLIYLCWGCKLTNKLTVFSCSVVAQKWMLCLIVMKAISLVVWHKDLVSIVTLIMSFYPSLNGCIASMASLHVVSELAHLLWWIPDPQIAVSSINNPNRNFKMRHVNWNISFTNKICRQVSFYLFPWMDLCALFQPKVKTKNRPPTSLLVHESAASHIKRHTDTQFLLFLCSYIKFLIFVEYLSQSFLTILWKYTFPQRLEQSSYNNCLLVLHFLCVWEIFRLFTVDGTQYGHSRLFWLLQILTYVVL